MSDIQTTATPTASALNSALVLEASFDERQYLVAEPIFVRCSLLNKGSAAITVPYSRYGSGCTFVLDIVAQDGSLLKRLEHERRQIGRRPIVVKPGRRLTETMNLYDEYPISRPGRYTLSVRFTSDGKYHARDRQGRNALQDDGWSGALTVRVGEPDIVAPTEPTDLRALREITPTGDLVPRSGAVRFPFIYAVRGPDNRRMLIEEFPKSRYTAYARYYQALGHLYGTGTQMTASASEAQRAVDDLESINRSEFPPLFQEMVLHELVKAHKAAADSLGEEFRRQFPESPYLDDKPE